METGDPRRALDALAGEHALPILRYLRGREWTLASEVAQGLGIHTSTASKYLTAFLGAGFVERRPHRSRRATHAYRLLSPVIRIELDLAEKVDATDVAHVAQAFLEALLEAARRVGGARLADDIVQTLFTAEDWRRELETRLHEAADPRTTLEGLLFAARNVCTDFVGRSTASRLFRIAEDAASEGHLDVIESLGILGGRP